MPKIQTIFGNKKKCGSCEELKPLAEFPKAKTKSGYYSYCKLCANSKNQSVYKRYKHSISERIKDYRRTSRGKEVMRKATAKQVLEHPERVAARAYVRKAVLHGFLTKSPCCDIEGCINRNIQAHHLLGYEQKHWLDIVWLCVKHHHQAETKPKQN